VVLDLLFAPVYYRLLLGHESLDRQFAVTSVRHLVAGLRTSATGAGIG
jgi:hypothetical protein